mgnify:CR=1 FL=1
MSSETVIVIKIMFSENGSLHPGDDLSCKMNAVIYFLVARVWRKLGAKCKNCPIFMKFGFQVDLRVLITNMQSKTFLRLPLPKWRPSNGFLLITRKPLEIV